MHDAPHRRHPVRARPRPPSIEDRAQHWARSLAGHDLSCERREIRPRFDGVLGLQVVAVVRPRGGLCCRPLTASSTADLAGPVRQVARRWGLAVTAVGWTPDRSSLVVSLVAERPAGPPAQGSPPARCAGDETYWDLVEASWPVRRPPPDTPAGTLPDTPAG